MANQLEFLTARATEARAEAEAALLENVRERCLRAATAWEAMAARAQTSADSRADQEARKAQRIEIDPEA